MIGAALAVDLGFEALGLVPAERDAKVVEASVTWNYTTFLDLAFLGLVVVLLWRFVRTGGIEMLRHMDEPHAHEHTHA
jgi:uncharacterized protein